MKLAPFLSALIAATVFPFWGQAAAQSANSFQIIPVKQYRGEIQPNFGSSGNVSPPSCTTYSSGSGLRFLKCGALWTPAAISDGSAPGLRLAPAAGVVPIGASVWPITHIGTRSNAWVDSTNQIYIVTESPYGSTIQIQINWVASI
eukprot:TRINITY_DN17688_c0_g1_i1.p1 TRINITY_DN17688_c0_g1~~TRINITY_DN17688_c0_g1_i1.p1  ORF type:complete len:146 (+),score=9.45 TRINITY_DN17688_c0_g1_i1:67-504(+)